MITFNQNTDLNVIESYNDKENDEIIKEIVESFKAGEVIDADPIENTLTEHRGVKYVDLQFADGAVALGVDQSYFKIVSD
jgi:hypothetical protein